MNNKIESAKRILLVEDDSNDIELMLTALEQHGLADVVAVAHDGEEALDYLLRRGAFAQRDPAPPSVILLDMHMPRRDGVAVLESIRGYRELQEIPVIAITSSVNKQVELARKGLRVLSYFIKPATGGKYFELMQDLAVLLKSLLRTEGGTRP